MLFFRLFTIVSFLFVTTLLQAQKIYDCFVFFNEYEVLEIRLNELYNYVDKFVIVESCESFRGLPKPFNFEREMHRYRKFMDKIIYVKVYDRQGGDNDWIRENYQKNQVMRALEQCKLDDLILFSDSDEFPPGELIPQAAQAIKSTPIIVFNQKMCRFFLNRAAPDWGTRAEPGCWFGTLAVRYDHLVGSPGVLPNQRRSSICFEGNRVGVVEWVGGWHFTSMGGFAKNLDKWNNWLHWKEPTPKTYEEWRTLVNVHPLIPIDQIFPKFVQENIPYLTEIGLIDVVEAE